MKRTSLIALLYVVLPMAMLPTLWGDPLSAGEDDVVYYYPLRNMVAEELSRGRLAMYNPREATGMPLLADPQSATLHPTSWLFVVLPGKAAYAATLYIAFSLAGGGAFLYMRRVGLVAPAAVFGSIVFMFCGFLVGHRVHQSVLLAACMLPWGLWIIERLRRDAGVPPACREGFQPSPSAVPNEVSSFSGQANGTHSAGGTPAPRRVWSSSFALLTPIVFWAFVAGHWPTFVHVMLIWSVYVLFRARPLIRSGVVVLAAVALALLAAAPQLAVTMEFMSTVTRQKIGLAMAGENSFFPTSAVLAFFPFLQGSRTPNFFPQSWWGSWHLCEMLGYVGLVTLVLAATAVWRGFRKGGDAARTQGKREHVFTGSPFCAVECSTAQKGEPVNACSQTPASLSASLSSFTPLVRAWTWMLIGAGIFMLGYYTPVYGLIHKIPVLGVMRCPARMVLAVDMALATLAAVAVHVLLSGDAAADERLRRLRRTLRSTAMVVLPAVMVGWLIVWAAIAAIGQRFGLDEAFGALQFVGGPKQMFAALGIHIHDDGGWTFTFTPAVWVPLTLTVATAVVIVFLLRATRRDNDAESEVGHRKIAFTGSPFCAVEHSTAQKGEPVNTFCQTPTSLSASPRRRMASSLLFALLLVDLFFVTRFVDVPAAGVASPDPDASPAARWLREHAPDVDRYRIYTLSPMYNHRPDELLHPKTCTMLGFHTIGNYGPFQSPWHVQMFGLRIWGLDRDWKDHVRENHLLSVYGVTFILAAEPEHRAVLDSVTIRAGLDSVSIPTDDPPPDGANLLTNSWQEAGDVGRSFGGLADVDADTSSASGATLRLRAPLFWWFAKVSQPVTLPEDGVYKLSFEARAPDGGATGFLQAVIENADCDPRHAWFEADELSSPASADDQTPWRRFERVMTIARRPGTGQRLTFATLSERTVEVRNVQLRRSHVRGPINFNHALAPGERVYELVAELPARNPSQPPVAIYENRLAQPIPTGDRLTPATDENVDALKFLDETTTTPPPAVPDLALPPVKNPARLFVYTTLPAAMIWLGVVVVARRHNPWRP